ncbi:MAG: thioredoxin domain-containing protein, partial [Elusimicrobia bacterium]|nr:thioredoxin domain-containing protein [Elusimicrobiota bacterium]
RVRVTYKHHPWEFHRYARLAAVFAECAGKQGKFWPVYDSLFARQSEWAISSSPEERFAAYAKEAGLDPAALAACRADPSAAALIDADLKEADDHWVQSTPTFFVNGRRYAGVRQLLSEGVPEIDKLLPRGNP